MIIRYLCFTIYTKKKYTSEYNMILEKIYVWKKIVLRILQKKFIKFKQVWKTLNLKSSINLKQP